MIAKVIYECGVCDCYHPWSWDGDCREDANRFNSPEEYAEAKGINVNDVEIRSMTQRVIADGTWMYQDGAYCLNQHKQHKFTMSECEEYGFGEGDQPDTCPTCGSRVQPKEST